MTLQEFKDKYLGKQVEYHSYGAGAYNQCVDLINAYINQCLDNNTKDYTEIIGVNAKDFDTNYDKEDFDWIANTPTGIPLRGDIMVWNGNVGGGAGHVAIFESGDANAFKSLDQNWSQVERVTEENHNYNNVDGWLRPKNQLQGGVVVDDIDAVRKERDRNWNLYQATLKERDYERAERNKNWELYQQALANAGSGKYDKLKQAIQKTLNEN